MAERYSNSIFSPISSINHEQGLPRLGLFNSMGDFDVYLLTENDDPLPIGRQRPIPTIGRFSWDLSYPEVPWDLSTLPGYQNSIFDDDNRNTSSQLEERKFSIFGCHDMALNTTQPNVTLGNEMAIDLDGDDETLNTTQPYVTLGNEMPLQFGDSDFDPVAYCVNVVTSPDIIYDFGMEPVSNITEDPPTAPGLTLTDGNVSSTTKPTPPNTRRKVILTETAQMVLRNNCPMTRDTLRAMAKDRLQNLELKPNQEIKFVHYGFGIKHPTFEKKYKKYKDTVKCLLCDETLKWGKDFKEHCLERHSGGHRTYLCTWCSLDFWDLYDLKRHSRRHSMITPFECELCFTVMKNEKGLIQHYHTVHNLNDVSKINITIYCRGCGFICKTHEELKQHMQMYHADYQSMFMRL